MYGFADMPADIGRVNRAATSVARFPVFVTDSVADLTVCEIRDLVEQLLVGEIRVDRTVGLQDFTTVHN